MERTLRSAPEGVKARTAELRAERPPPGAQHLPLKPRSVEHVSARAACGRTASCPPPMGPRTSLSAHPRQKPVTRAEMPAVQWSPAAATNITHALQECSLPVSHKRVAIRPGNNRIQIRGNDQVCLIGPCRLAPRLPHSPTHRHSSLVHLPFANVAKPPLATPILRHTSR
jgi:hypothetical protein